jgi:DMSO/TMAO reductase YedYZ heme-binding membrane subunit
MAIRRGPLPWLNPGILVGASAPLLSILLRARSGALGANPIAEALNELGLMALVLLIASLACTPLRTLVGWTWPIRVRRLLGLLAFAYATLHVAVYAGLDQGLDLRAVLADVFKRKFIFVGFAAFVMMIPLAWTSTKGAVRRWATRGGSGSTCWCIPRPSAPPSTSSGASRRTSASRSPMPPSWPRCCWCASSRARSGTVAAASGPDA